MKRKHWWLCLGILILISFACNLPKATPTPAYTADIITEMAKTVNAQMTQIASPLSRPGH